AGPFQNKLFLLLVDSYSKWMEVVEVSSTSSLVTIGVLRKIFATHGLPDTVVSDNATGFTSGEFSSSLAETGIAQIFTPPSHPASNGQVERYVQSFKSCIKKMEEEEGTFSEKLARLLIEQHACPSSVTRKSPAEL